MLKFKIVSVCQCSDSAYVKKRSLACYVTLLVQFVIETLTSNPLQNYFESCKISDNLSDSQLRKTECSSIFLLWSAKHTLIEIILYYVQTKGWSDGPQHFIHTFAYNKHFIYIRWNSSSLEKKHSHGRPKSRS